MKHLTLATLFTFFLCLIHVCHSESVTLLASFDRNPDKHEVEFSAKSSFTLKCNISDSSKKITWKKDGKDVDSDSRTSFSNSGSLHALKIENAVDTDAGNYTCHYEDSYDFLTVVSRVYVKVPDSINVVEGEKLRIHCQIAGNPPPKLSWLYTNETTNITLTESTGRYKLESDPERNLTNADLKIDEVEQYDVGFFTCVGTSHKGDTVTSSCQLRVKGKYAALWPFLGICAEVFILCAIIFIYEKKRNKTEMEESDTDQSPDQKNTDPGKDTNLRHRQ